VHRYKKLNYIDKCYQLKIENSFLIVFRWINSLHIIFNGVVQKIFLAHNLLLFHACLHLRGFLRIIIEITRVMKFVERSKIERAQSERRWKNSIKSLQIGVKIKFFKSTSSSKFSAHFPESWLWANIFVTIFVEFYFFA
jgi:hypothetical protein